MNRDPLDRWNEKPGGTGAQDYFRANLRALEAADPVLAARLRRPAGRDHLRETGAGGLALAYRRTWHPLALDEGTLETLVRAARGAGDVLLFGIGLGEVVPLLLARYPELELRAWDRDPELVRRFLARVPVAEALRSRRLRLALTADILDLVEGPTLPRPRVLIHPLLGAVYRHERRILEEGARGRYALLCEGELFVDDLAAALRAEGYTPFPVDPVVLSREELEITVRRVNPAFFAVVNYRRGMAEFCEGLDLPLLAWEVDPFMDRLPPLRTRAKRSFLFTYRAADVPAFRAAGFTRAEYLPLAANPKRRRPLRLTPEERARYAAPVTFVGSSLVGSAEEARVRFLRRYLRLRPGDEAFRKAVVQRMEAVLAEQRRDYTTFRIPDLFAERFHDLERESAAAGAGGEDPVKLLAETAASEKRLLYAGALAPLGIAVYGDEGWKRLEPAGVRYRGPAAHGRELTRIYCAARINLDIGRLYQTDMVPMRVFDVLACGGFLLAEYTEALAALFTPGREVECFRGKEELREKAAFYLDHPDSAREIAKRGMEKVRTLHTVQDRLRHMLGVLASVP